jgi:hypothetical protein
VALLTVHPLLDDDNDYDYDNGSNNKDDNCTENILFYISPIIIRVNE